MSGCVYIAEFPESKVIKIGSSTDVVERIRILQSANPYKVGRVYQSIKLPTYVQCEKSIQKHFAGSRCSGGTEWFTVSYEEACAIAETVCRESYLQCLLLENSLLKDELEKLKNKKGENNDHQRTSEHEADVREGTAGSTQRF